MSEQQLLIEIWDLVTPFIPDKDRPDIAKAFVQAFELNVDMDSIDEIRYIDPDLDEAIVELGLFEELEDE